MTRLIWLPMIGSTQIAVDEIHRFGTDTLLLAWFSAPRHGERVCELGTGCGAIALRLCAANDPAQVHGIDIAPEAIALARQSAARFAERSSPSATGTRRAASPRPGSSTVWCAIRRIFRRAAGRSAPIPRHSAPGTSGPARWRTCAPRPHGCCALAGGCACATGRSGCRTSSLH